MRIAGADQIERVIELVPERDREGVRASHRAAARSGSRRPDTGSFDFGAGVATGGLHRAGQSSGSSTRWRFPVAHTFVTTGGLIVAQLLPEGCLRPQAARRQLRLPLPAAHRRHRGQRAAEAARRSEAEEAPRARSSARRSRCSARLQARHRRHPRGLQPGARRRLQGEGANVRVYDPVAGRSAARARRRGEDRDPALDALQDADGAVLVTEWAEFKELDWGPMEAAMRDSACCRRPQLPGPRGMIARRASSTRASAGN